MKNHRNHQHNGNGEKSESAHLEFSHPTAKAVAIAGTFNDWRPEATPMVSLGDGRWIKDLTLPPGAYEYLFVADGQWMRDPLAMETAPNPFGGENSILRMPKMAKSMEVPFAIPAEGQTRLSSSPTGLPDREACVQSHTDQSDASSRSVDRQCL